jgi:DNA polymerase III subunit epsilon
MYAVVDTETTGLSPTSDRIIELAIIGLDECGEPQWEWCSLINPERDTGPGLAVRVHQIYPRDVAGVPRFSQT